MNAVLLDVGAAHRAPVQVLFNEDSFMFTRSSSRKEERGIFDPEDFGQGSAQPMSDDPFDSKPSVDGSTACSCEHWSATLLLVMVLVYHCPMVKCICLFCRYLIDATHWHRIKRLSLHCRCIGHHRKNPHCHCSTVSRPFTDLLLQHSLAAISQVPNSSISSEHFQGVI